MEILWFAIVIYSIGLGLLLHFRPAYMFHENGSWKEFGYQRDSRHTLFPFWLFAIAWAFVSYVLAASIVWSFFTPFAAVAATAHLSSEDFIRPASSMVEEEEEEDADAEAEEDYDDVQEDQSNIKDVRIRNTNRTTNRNIHYEHGDGAVKPTARPGYYVIDPSSKHTGIRRYIYYGPTPPTD